MITDIVLPGVDGIELARRLVDRHPDLRVIYVSGYAERVREPEQDLPPNANFVQKPYTPQAIARRLREVSRSAARIARSTAHRRPGVPRELTAL